ncbi:MAG: hypothetical protein KAI79_17715, partial [Bacteroidales bacterium]|nr:hypothetical protein [Bacteroidales bacterium]
IKPLKNEKKDQKLHNCLIPILDFPRYIPSCFKDNEELSELIEWDIYSFMYIPNYLAEARYKLRSLEDKS